MHIIPAQLKKIDQCLSAFRLSVMVGIDPATTYSRRNDATTELLRRGRIKREAWVEGQRALIDNSLIYNEVIERNSILFHYSSN